MIFWRPVPLKSSILLRKSNDFDEIAVFENMLKNDPILVIFGSQNEEKTRKKHIKKCIRLEDGFFERFFAIFRDFGLILGGPGEAWGLPKIIKSAKKSNLGVFGRYLGSEGGFGVTFGRNLGGIWDLVDKPCADLARIWKHWALLGQNLHLGPRADPLCVTMRGGPFREPTSVLETRSSRK